MTKQLWLSVLLKDTSAATGQAGIRTHILITPELKSTALDRSAMTLPEKKVKMSLEIPHSISWELDVAFCLLEVN